MPSPLGHALGGVIAGVLSHTLLREPQPGAITPGVLSPAPQTTPGVSSPDGRGVVAGVRRRWHAAPADVRLFAWLGMAADLDFFVGRHSRETHSVGAMVLVGIGLAIVTRRPRLVTSGALAYASHILLDWLGSDTTPPLGVMALWPLTADFYQSSWFLFDAISRRVWLWSTWVHNAEAVAREILILGPVVVLALALWPGWQELRRTGRP